jgi:hypothetical protein
MTRAECLYNTIFTCAMRSSKKQSAPLNHRFRPFLSCEGWMVPCVAAVMYEMKYEMMIHYTVLYCTHHHDVSKVFPSSTKTIFKQVVDAYPVYK